MSNYILGTDVLASGLDPADEVPDVQIDTPPGLMGVLHEIHEVLGLVPSVPPHWFQHTGSAGTSTSPPWPTGNIMFWPSVSEYPLDPGFYIDDGSGYAQNLQDLDPNTRYGVSFLDTERTFDEDFDHATLRNTGAFRTGTGRMG